MDRVSAIKIYYYYYYYNILLDNHTMHFVTHKLTNLVHRIRGAKVGGWGRNPP